MLSMGLYVVRLLAGAETTALDVKIKSISFQDVGIICADMVKEVLK